MVDYRRKLTKEDWVKVFLFFLIFHNFFYAHCFPSFLILDSKCIIYDSKIYIPTIDRKGFSGSADIQLRSSGNCTIIKTFSFSMENSTFVEYDNKAWDIDPFNKNKLWVSCRRLSRSVYRLSISKISLSICTTE